MLVTRRISENLDHIFVFEFRILKKCAISNRREKGNEHLYFSNSISLDIVPRDSMRTILFMRTICGIYTHSGRGGQADRRDPVRYFSEGISLRPEANKRGTRTTDRFILVLAVSLNRSHRWPRAECQIRSRGIYFRRRKRRGSCHFFHKISYNVWRISIISYVVKLETL